MLRQGFTSRTLSSKLRGTCTHARETRSCRPPALFLASDPSRVKCQDPALQHRPSQKLKPPQTKLPKPCASSGVRPLATWPSDGWCGSLGIAERAQALGSLSCDESNFFPSLVLLFLIPKVPTTKPQTLNSTVLSSKL